MKNKYFTYRFIQCMPVLLAFFFQSCEKMIEIDLPDNQINTEDVFKDINTTKAALANLYSNVRETPLFKGGSNGLGCDFSKFTDDLDSFGQNDYFYQNTISSNNSPSNEYWIASYKNIYAINIFISGLTMSEYISESDKQVFLGEAYFLRALYHQKLTQLFGSIPYIESMDYKSNTTVSKINTNEVLNKIEQDLIKAIEVLSDEYRSEERIYPNRAVAELVLAQNYLLQNQYALAEQTAKAIVDNSLFKIESDLNRVFKKDAASTLWQMSPISTGSGGQYSQTYEAMSYIFSGLPPTTIALSDDLISVFQNNDTRKVRWIQEVTDGIDSYFYAYKYKNKENNTDEYSIVFRIEEAYFVLMEALAYQNRIPEAIGYLNTIRNRAGLDDLPSTLSQTGFIDAMLEESRREFFTEGGHRFFDLKRNNRLHILKEVKPNWEDKHALFPIPESEILLNPNLLPQNEGY